MAPHAASRPVTWFRSRRGLLALLGVLLTVLFLARPGVDKLRTRIARTVGVTLGRRVEISSASLRLLPQPGFDLQNFIVYDDPAFSAEPILRSGEVTASLRITSLLRGRLEIARLSLTEPSLNMVRNSQGHWNLEYLLERASKTAVAPTAKAKNEMRPAFPYIEASRGRINFRFGFEKKQFALTEADFALFQDSENTWGVRLAAKPVRTDSNSSDTGLLKISGSWRRAPSLRETPLRFSLQWEQAQLGQASKLFYGSDKGWRGEASIFSEIRGTPADLTITADASVDDFRRYDILAGSPLRLRAQCDGHYSSATHILSKIICQSPFGDGALTLHGAATVSPNFPVYHLAVSAQEVPAQALVLLARHSKKEIPDDLLAAGTLDATVKVQREERDGKGSTVWEGGGETSELRLTSQIANSGLSVDKIHFSISSAEPRTVAPGKHRHVPAENTPFSGEHRVDVTPFTVALGGPVPSTIHGWLSRSGYSFTMEGGARLQQLLRAARLVGIPSPQPAADGLVRVDLQIADAWSGFKSPRVTGKAELDSVRGQVRGMNAPIEIDAAEVLLGQDQVNVQSLTAHVSGSTWRGSMTMPRPCPVIAACQVQFNLHADEIATDNLDKLFNSRYAKTPWYRFLISQGGTPFLLAIHATGKLSADRVLIHTVAATQISATVDLDHGKLHLTDFRGAVLGGSHIGEWNLDFSANPPQYGGTGTFQRIALTQVATAMHDDWVSGTAEATYHATASGSTAAELFSTVTAILQLKAREGTLPHIVLTNFAGPLQFRRFEGNLVLRHKELDFEEANLEAPGAAYQVTGTASLGRVLNLRLERAGNRVFNITGMLDAPMVLASPFPETQVALKP